MRTTSYSDKQSTKSQGGSGMGTLTGNETDSYVQ